MSEANDYIRVKIQVDSIVVWIPSVSPSKEKPVPRLTLAHIEKKRKTKTAQNKSCMGAGCKARTVRNSRSGDKHRNRCLVERMLWRDGIHWSELPLTSSGFNSKYIRTSFSRYRKNSEFKFPPEMGSARSADEWAGFPPNPESKRVFHAPRGSSFANANS